MSARDWALARLDEHPFFPGWKPNQIRRRIQPPNRSLDVALSERIYLTVVQNLLLLQRLITHHSGKPLKAVDQVLQKILAVGLAQLRFMDRIPPSAAVDEAVEQAKRFGRSRGAGGFVNAILRNALRNPDPADLPPSIALSHPQPLLDRLAALLGPTDALALALRHNTPPPTIIRTTNGIPKGSTRVTFTPHEVAGMFVVSGASQADFAEWARAGVAQVQDPTAARVVDMCDIRPGHRVLDYCCGSGTKTLQMWERVGNEGVVVATDVDSERVARLRELLAARKINNVQASLIHESEHLKSGSKAFDRVIIDVPCSNSGVLARRAEARYRQDEPRLKALKKVQQTILRAALPQLAPGGLLVYSTCSIWKEENHGVIAEFLGEHGQLRLVSEKQTLPSLDCDPARHHDGGYVAVLSGC